MEGNLQEFSATYDRTAKILSSLCAVVVLIPGVMSRNLLIAAVGLVVLGLAYVFSPRGYAISQDSILVKRMIGAVRVPLSGIRVVRAAAASDFRGCIRLFGSGGLFGYYGTFRTTALGKCTWYMTDRSKAVVVMAEGKTVLLSPEDVEGFLGAVRMVHPAAKVSSAEDAAMFAPIEPGGSGNPVVWVAAAMAVVGVVVAAAMLYSPGPPAVDLTDSSVTVHDLFHSVTVNAAAVDVPQVRVVDLDEDSGWRPAWKLRGFSNPFYRSGLFRAANGREVQFFAGKSSRLVLLPPKSDGTPVLIEAPEPETLAAELRKDWGGRP